MSHETEQNADPWPEIWIAQVFSAKAVQRGGVVRRKLRDIDRIVGRDRFLWEVRRRGFHALENNGNLVIFCNRAPIRIVT